MHAGDQVSILISREEDTHYEGLKAVARHVAVSKEEGERSSYSFSSKTGRYTHAHDFFNEIRNLNLATIKKAELEKVAKLLPLESHAPGDFIFEVHPRSGHG